MIVDRERMVRVKRQFSASAERVFDAWLDPATAGKWLYATPTGTMTRLEIDARVGGKFLFVRRESEDIEHVGEYLEIDRPKRLVFTMAVPKFSSEYTRVTVDIVPRKNGCELTLTHEGVLPDWMEKTQQGWGMILDGLASSLDPSSSEYGVVIDPGTIRFERLLPGPIERVWSYLTDSNKRGQWLASGEMEPRVGGSVELKFQHATLSTKTAPAPERFQGHDCHLSHDKVLRFEPPHLLSISWDDGGQPSDVTFELSPQADKVLLVLTHRRLANRKAMVEVGTGWHSHLVVLQDRLEGREPDAFWTIFNEIDGKYEDRIAGE